jgi:hypothetical protein
MTFIASNSDSNDSTQTVTDDYGTGPQVIAPEVNFRFWNAPGGAVYTSNSGNQYGDGMIINSPAGNGNANVSVWVTPNYNPPGQPANYLNHNIGVWWDGSGGAAFNQDRTLTRSHRSYGQSESRPCRTAQAVGGGFGDPNGIYIITPVWNPYGRSPGAYNDHPTGVWYDGSQWWVYNEDYTAMPAGVAFNVHPCDPNDGAYIHYANSSNTSFDYTILDNPNLHGQPNAKVFVTHNWRASPGYNTHPTGVFYTPSNCAIFVRTKRRWTTLPPT